MRKYLLLFISALSLVISNNSLYAQNSLTGDGFGGRLWYKAHNYQAGSYGASTVCGSDNQLFAWGANRYSELGDSTLTGITIPIGVQGMDSVKFYTCGYVSGVIKEDNTAWVWGGGQWTGLLSSPTYMLSDVKFIDGGESHLVFVKNDGTVWGVGRNAFGELGDGHPLAESGAVTTPVQMIGVNTAVRAIAAGGGTHGPATIILLADGTLKITGGWEYFSDTYQDIPVPIVGLSNIVDIKACNSSVYALKDNGDVYSFGRDIDNVNFGTLGLGITCSNCGYSPPQKITFPIGASPIIALSANNDGQTAFALDENGKMYGWGDNRIGQLGDGTFINKQSPVLLDTGVIDVFAGEIFTYSLKSDNTLWCSGASSTSWTLNTGSIWMNLPDILRNTFTQIDPTLPPMNLCAPKVWGVVPIKLSSFTCVANGNNAFLNWQSAEETNASKYIVQYSNDGTTYKDIATVFATGSNSKYNYTHQQVSGTAFYRLKMMDKDGSFTYSEIRVIKFDSKVGFTIAPNPANVVIHLYTKYSNDIKLVQVFSGEGKLLQSINNYKNNEGINVSKLSSGTHIIKVVFKNDIVEYSRFIKL